jgi:hypothetical protein
MQEPEINYGIVRLVTRRLFSSRFVSPFFPERHTDPRAFQPWMGGIETSCALP